jgi:hypothetical protein
MLTCSTSQHQAPAGRQDIFRRWRRTLSLFGSILTHACVFGGILDCSLARRKMICRHPSYYSLVLGGTGGWLRLRLSAKLSATRRRHDTCVFSALPDVKHSGVTKGQLRPLTLLRYLSRYALGSTERGYIELDSRERLNPAMLVCHRFMLKLSSRDIRIEEALVL